MAQQTDLAIRIAAIFDAAGINKADKSISKLEKKAKGLGKSLGIALSVAAVTAYGKAAVKAFAEDEKAALSLARTIQNLGLGFEAQGDSVNKYISSLEQQTGVLDDELRPALDRLLRSTLDIKKAQDLLNLSLDIAAGTGKSVTQVSQSLQKAYLGQTQAIGRLGVGLSKAELTTASFEEIQKRLTYLFAGQAQDAAESYAGQIDKLTIASNNAKETIGKGLVDSLVILSGSGNIDGLVSKMEGFSQSIANASVEMAKLIAGVKFIFNPKNFFKSGDEFQRMLDLIEMGKPVRKFDIGNNAVTGYKKDKAAQTQALKASAAQVKATKALTAEQKKQAALKKAGTVFDLEQIQIIAALKGKLSEEDKIRLQAQLAILNENEALASSLTKQILMAQDSTGGLYKFFLAIGDMKIKNPFAFLDEWIIEFQKKLNALKFPNLDPNAPNNGSKKPPVVDPTTNPFGFPIGDKGGIGTTSIQPSLSSNLAIQDTFNAVMIDALEAGNNYTQSAILALSSARYEAAAQAYGMGGASGAQVIELKITGGDDVSKAIANNLQQQSLSTGNVTYINRRTGGFE